MDTPNIAQTAPMVVNVEAGKTYWWCACGRSKNQPFCDGSHKGSSFSPMEWQATTGEQKWFCCCKHSAKKPFCDGTHKKLG